MIQKKNTPPHHESPPATVPDAPEEESPVDSQDDLSGVSSGRPLQGGPEPSGDIEGGTEPRAPSGNKTGGPPPMPG